MKTKFMKSLALCLCLTFSLVAYTQSSPRSDTVFSRMVTVERDYQPTVESASRISQSPAVLQTDIAQTPVVWSVFSDSVQVSVAPCPYTAAETTFPASQPTYGLLRGAVGHQNSDFRFAYRVTNTNKFALHLFANHDGAWGSRTVARSSLGLEGKVSFSSSELFFGLDGQDEFFNRYGRYYDGSQGLRQADVSLDSTYWQHFVTANTHVGIRSKQGEAFCYRVQVGYTAFVVPDLATEHQVRTHLDFAYKGDHHEGGVNMYVQNHFYVAGNRFQTVLDGFNHHAFAAEPYYGYHTQRFSLHVGVNLDFHMGRGQQFTELEKLSFAPSPNVRVDWTTDNDILNLYADVRGSFGTGSMQDFYRDANRYLRLTATTIPAVQNVHLPSYTPVDATIGMRIRPVNTMLVTLHGGYAVLKNQTLVAAPSMDVLERSTDTYLDALYANYQRWTVGADLHYHWRDILVLNVKGNYYGYRLDTLETVQEPPTGRHVYNRPAWDAALRLDWHISRQWTVYTDNRFAGGAWALVYDTNGTLSEQALCPTVTLNLGASYAFNRWLSAWLQVDNLLNRHDDIFYGYQTQGIHFLLGVKWKF